MNIAPLRSPGQWPSSACREGELIESSPQGSHHSFFSHLVLLAKLIDGRWNTITTALVIVFSCKLQQDHISDGQTNIESIK